MTKRLATRKKPSRAFRWPAGLAVALGDSLSKKGGIPVGLLGEQEAIHRTSVPSTRRVIFTEVGQNFPHIHPSSRKRGNQTY